MPPAIQHTDVTQSPNLPWSANQLERVETCPVCGGTLRDRLYEGLTDRVFRCAPGEWTLYSCRSCRSAYLDPRPTPNSIGLAYQNYFTHEVASELDASRGFPLGSCKAAIRNDYLNSHFGASLYPRLPLGRLAISLRPYTRLGWGRTLRHLALPSKSARLLDIGCGNGDFLQIASSLGWDALGMDPDPQAVAAVRKTGLSVLEGGLPHTGLPDEEFGAVTLSHVIEHVHDPVVALQEVHRILKPGGKVWIATPNLEGDGHHLFNRHWRGLEPPRHLVIFNASSLKLACERTGFENVILPRPSPVARWYFLASLKILQNQDPTGLEKPYILPLTLKWRARWSDLNAILFPGWGEELVMIGTKPHQ